VPRKGVPLIIAAPDLAQEAFGWDPSSISAGSEKRLSWRCDRGHVWQAIVANRFRKGVGCPFCSNFRALPGFNDLATTNPSLAAQADGWDPSTVTSGSGEKKAWICAAGHQWVATVNSRNKGAGCPTCAGQRTLPGLNDLATTHPSLAAEAVGWDPSTVRHGGNERVRWRCKLGHEYLLSVSARVRGNGCTVCAGKVVVPGFNDVASQYPYLVSQSVTLDLTRVTPGSRRRGMWRCEQGHEYESSVVSRTRGSGCPICANYLIVPGINDIATTHPELALEAHGWDATLYSRGHGKPLEWKCTRGHIWRASPELRTRGKGEGCPYCSNHRVLSGFNDLGTTNPALAAQADGWNPSFVIAGTHAKRKWKCPNGHRWSAAVNSRNSGVGCPSCATSGFNPSKRGWLYLIRHEQMQLLQFGVTNVPEQRLATHAKGGWEVVDLRGPMDGWLAREWENAFKDLTRKLRLTMGKDLGHGVFTGFTEAWRRQEFPVHTIVDLMREVERNEGRDSSG